jgi:hypothetical protein
MVASAFIPIPPAIIARSQLDLTANENQMGTEHYFAWDSSNRLGVLTFLWSLQVPGTYYFSIFDENGILRHQYNLPKVAALMNAQDRLYPTAIEFSVDGYVLIGGYGRGADGGFRSGLYVANVEQDRVVQRLPWFAARIAWTQDDFLFGTLQANDERPVRKTLDDAIIISSAPQRGRFEPAKALSGLAPMRLVAVLDPDSPKWYQAAYQGLLPSQPRQPLRRGPGFGGIYQTHSIVPLNNGNVLASIWCTAMSQILDYYFAIFSRDGDRLHEINDGVEKHSQITNDPVHGRLVYRDTSEIRIYDYQGQRLATVPLDKSSASTLKRYELVSIAPQGRLLFASQRLKQMNCFFILEASDRADYAEYQRVVTAGAKAHKSWLAKKKKELNPTFFRWTR